MPDNLKTPRYPRVEREEAVTVREDENAHLWAISYSDFLMAILSFFILFYSADSSKRKTFIINLGKELSMGNGTRNGTQENADPKDGRFPASLTASLSKFDVQVEHLDESLVLNFSDDFFRPGGYQLSDSRTSEVQDVLEKLRPFAEQVNLYFEGHADDRPVKIHKDSLLRDNFVLSSLRASSALLLAKDLGFPDKHMFIRAASSNIRNSRSLSIRVEPMDSL